MRVSMFAAASLIALAALPAAAQPGTYTARGTEPFWSLTIGARTMTFTAPGRRTVSVPTPRVIHGFAGEIWQSKRLSVSTRHAECSDGMSDRTYPDTVTVIVDGRNYKGCGGEPRAEAPHGAAIDGSWRIEALYGRPVSPQTSPTVTFRSGRMSGNASCNHFSASYRFERGKLVAGPIASTRKFCALRVQNVQDSTVTRLFEKPLSVSRNRAGKLVLTSPEGTTMTLAPTR